MAGCQGAQPGPCSAPWWLPPSPAGTAAARLAAGAGCAGCWHKPPPADGVNPWRLRRNLGASPRVRRVVFRPVQSSSLAAGVMGRSRTCDNRLSAGLYQTELPVVARLESNQAVPFGVVTTTVPSLSSVCDVRHAEHRQSPKAPDARHRRGGLLSQPWPVSGHRLRWMSCLLPDACQVDCFSVGGFVNC